MWALGCVAGAVTAATGQPQWTQSWRPELGFFDSGPTCLLNPPDDMSRGGLYVSFDWNASDGASMWLNWREDSDPSLRLESEGGDSWDLALEPRQAHFDGRRAFLDAKVAAGVMRSLQIGHALAVLVSVDNVVTRRHHVPAHGAHIAVPMYQACIRSVIEDPPRYLFRPGRSFMGSYKAGERCEFTQIIELGHIPLVVTLSAEADGGEILFARTMSTHAPHGPLHTRRTPDRVEAQPLFGPGFDLVEEFRYAISNDQLNVLTAELERGNKRGFNLTTPEGEKSTLNFGGRLGKPFAAMFAACRQARFSTKHPGDS
jgi:hypothetical protein